MRTRRLLNTAALVAATAGVAVGTAGAVTPANGGDAGGTPVVVDNGPGDQSEPHVSGNLAVYTERTGPFTPGTIRYFDFVTGLNGAVLPGAPGDSDILSDVNGSRIVFSRTRASDNSTAIMLFDASNGTVNEVDPQGAEMMRFGAVVGGNTVSYAEFAFNRRRDLCVRPGGAYGHQRLAVDRARYEPRCVPGRRRRRLGALHRQRLRHLQVGADRGRLGPPAVVADAPPRASRTPTPTAPRSSTTPSERARPARTSTSGRSWAVWRPRSSWRDSSGTRASRTA